MLNLFGREQDKANVFSLQYESKDQKDREDIPDDAFVVLVMGPSGSGKSHLINVLFNKAVALSKCGSKGVTLDVEFLHGRFKGPGVDRRVVVIGKYLDRCVL